MNAELLTYSRSKGAFAGLTLEGAVIEQDSDSTIAIYGKDVPFRTVLMGNVKPPAAAAPFMAAVSMAGHQAAAAEAKDKAEDSK
jgi:lipid-binding SYLF domain-containing protein